MSVLAGAARGVVAAMAMTGMRSLTKDVGLVELTPPEEITRDRGAPVELAHWSFGAAAGAAYTLLPARVRHAPFSGPAYGVAIWALFETVLAPLVGQPERDRKPGERLSIVADHVLYGLILDS